MSDEMHSPHEAADHGKRTGRRALGCALPLALLATGLVIAGVVLWPRWQDLPINQATAVPPAIDDPTSPEKLAAHREPALARLGGYGWVDEEAGIAHIPIDRAIALVAENGLPVGPEVTPEADQPAADPPADDESPTPGSPVDLANVSFQNDVLPIFEEHCSECHGSEDPEENLELTRYRTAMVGSQNGPVIVPGDPDNSYLVDQIVSGQMPKRRDPLSPGEIEIIIAWIEAGAPDN